MSGQNDDGAGAGTVLKRMNMVFDPSDPRDAKFLELYASCTDGVKLHLCKEMILAALPDSRDEEDLLLARAMRRASGSRRGRPSKQVQRPVSPPSPRPQVAAPVVAEAPAPSPAAVAEGSGRRRVSARDFAGLAGGVSDWQSQK